jgi:hypothetical protein
MSKRNKKLRTRKQKARKGHLGNDVQVFKVQLEVTENTMITGKSVLIYNRNKSILIQDDASRYEEDFLNRLKRNGRAYVIMRVYPDRLHFLGYTDDKGW